MNSVYLKKKSYRFVASWEKASYGAKIQISFFISHVHFIAMVKLYKPAFLNFFAR